MSKRIIVLIFVGQAGFAQLDTIWTKTYFPGEDSLSISGRSLQPTADGGFVILGTQESDDIEPTIFLLKANTNGEQLWTNILPYKTYEKVKAYSIGETPDSGFVVLTMESNYSCYDDFNSSSISILVLFRLDSSGDTLWTRSYLQDYENDQHELCFHLFEVIVSQNENLLLYGSYYVGEQQKTWLLKTDPLGEPIWENTYDYNNTEAVTQGPDGSIFITGGHGGQGSPGTAFILKINQNGDQEWVRHESEPIDTKGDIIHSTYDNGIVVAGDYTDWAMGSTGPWLWKTDSLGNTEWDINLDAEGLNNVGNLVQQPDGTFIIAGGWGLSYALLNMDDSTSYSFNYSGLNPAIDIKSMSGSTQVTLINNNYYAEIPHIVIAKTRYISSYCTADDVTDGVELWGECYSIQNTTELDLSYMEITGEIPPAIGQLTNLTSLILKENQFSGVIPPEIGSLINLTDLDLGGNQLTGEIPPELGSLTDLTILDLAGNQLSGPIPPEICNLQSLTELELGGNQLTGSIPSEIGNLSSLIFIHLEYNQFMGEIPPELGDLNNLVWLNFVHNQLSGEIPSSICNLDMNWEDPNNFNISENQLCPPYPSCIEEYVGEQETANCDQVSIMDETFPLTYKLHIAYPNPFNPVTTLRYDLPEDALVNITIYDMMGRIVKGLVSSKQNIGYRSIQWNATNDAGSPVSAGIYLYTIQVGDFRQTKKVVLLK